MRSALWVDSSLSPSLPNPAPLQAFKLNVSAVVSERLPRRLPMPDHLPGRPVYRLRRWAAAARGRTWPPESSGSGVDVGSSSSTSSRSSSSAGEPPSAAQLPGPGASSAGGGGSSSNGAAAQGAAPDVAGAAAVAAAAAAAAGSAPFPSQHVYISHDEHDEDEYVGPAELAAAAEVAELAVAELEADEDEDRSGQPGGLGPAGGLQADAGQLATLYAGGDGGRPGQGQGPGRQALLHCRTQVTMAVRVPKALRVVPNALLGYAGAPCLILAAAACVPVAGMRFGSRQTGLSGRLPGLACERRHQPSLPPPCAPQAACCCAPCLRPRCPTSWSCWRQTTGAGRGWRRPARAPGSWTPLWASSSWMRQPRCGRGRSGGDSTPRMTARAASSRERGARSVRLCRSAQPAARHPLRTPRPGILTIQRPSILFLYSCCAMSRICLQRHFVRRI